MATQTYVDGVTLTAAAEFNRFDTVSYSALTSVAGTNTVTATGPANYSYAATTPAVWFTPAATNTGATTINVTPSGASALGAKNVFANGAACVGGELKIGVPTAVIYDGTQFNVVGPQLPATQAQQETGTAQSVYVSPAVQQFHPSAVKAWGSLASTPSIVASYNITSVADGGAGVVTVTIATDFSSGGYAVLSSANDSGTFLAWPHDTSAGSFTITIVNLADSASDRAVSFVCLGDQ